jgi:hypothetical protein
MAGVVGESAVEEHGKRHILVDRLGLLSGVAVHPANVQGRDGVLCTARRSFPFIVRIFADAGYPASCELHRLGRYRCSTCVTPVGYRHRTLIVESGSGD